MTCLLCFVLGFGGNTRLDFGFPSYLTASTCNFVRCSLAALLILQLDWLEIINQSNFSLLETWHHLSYFHNHEFYCRLPGLNKTGKTVPGKRLFALYELVLLDYLARGSWNCQNSKSYKDLRQTSFTNEV